MTLIVDTIEKAIEYQLSLSTGLAAYVGSAGDARIYSNVADQPNTQSSDPYVVIIVDEMDPEHTCDGTNVRKYLYYTDIYHENLPLATKIATEIKNVIEPYSNYRDAIYIQESWLNDETMAYNDEAERHVLRLQWISRVLPSPT